MSYPCHMIQDLMIPCLYGSCSPETQAAVTEHLQQCPTCRQRYCQMGEEAAQTEYETAQIEKWGIFWMLKTGFDRNRRKLLKGAVVLASACMLLSALYGAWWGLTQVDCVPVSSGDYQVAEVLQLPEGDIFCAYQARYASTFTHHYLISDNAVYFPAMRPILDKAGSGDGCWRMDPMSVWDKPNQEYIPVEAIYLGNPDYPEDAILIWEQGMELPLASAEDLARIHSFDWTIF